MAGMTVKEFEVLVFKDKFSKDDKATLNLMRSKKFPPKPGEWFADILPFQLIVGDYETGLRVQSIIDKYEPKCDLNIEYM